MSHRGHSLARLPLPAAIRAAAIPVAAMLAAAALAGCGGTTNHAGAGRGRRSAQKRAVAIAEATHEYPSPPPRPERAPGAPGPVQAIASFARAYINWDAADVSARMSLLARASVGTARSEMSLAAAETRTDSALQQGGISNRGSVEAVAPLAGRADVYVVVTREVTVASASDAYQGLAPAWHLTLATVQEEGGGQRRRWVISAWQPEN